MCEIDKDFIELKILKLDSLLKILIELYYNAEEIKLGFFLEVIKEESTALHKAYETFYTKI